ncbi:AMP-dependent synthetase and ligase [Chytriomyces cf. hyalinus JEL632]|nr:AMP-dependent synthetase and ligase [Chytriomyces cf. hyalinus JEL632]
MDRITSKAIQLPRFSVFRNAATKQLQNKVAVVDVRGSFTYAQLLRDADRLGRGPLADIRKGSRVAFLFPRQYSYVAVQWAIWAKECIAVPLCTAHPANELAHVISDSQSSIVLHHPTFTNALKDALLDDRLQSLNVRTTVVTDSDLEPIVTSNNIEQVSVAEFREMDKDQGAMIIYTSGTTGKPKGVLTTFANIEAQVSSLLTAWKWVESDKILLVLPLHHVHKKLSPKQTWSRFTSPSRDLTLFMAVPTIYARLLEHFDSVPIDQQSSMTSACAQFRLMVSGSAALPSPVFDKWERVSGHRLLERYGMTEIGMALGNRYEGPRLPGKVGVPFQGVEARIQDENGEDVTLVPGSTGELLIRGPQVFKEYWNNPKATKKSFNGEWFLTGDIVTITQPHSYFQILGRASMDIIKSGGFKLSALTIERELLSLKGVTDVAVLGIPDEVWGERVAAVVAMQEDVQDAKAMEAQLALQLKDAVAKYEVPTLWRFCREIPRNAMGKVNKKQLVPLF